MAAADQHYAHTLSQWQTRSSIVYMPDTDSRGTDSSATRNGSSWVNHLQRSISCELDYRMTMCSQEERMEEKKPTSCIMYCFGIHLERPRKVSPNQYILIPTIIPVIVTWRLYLLSCFRSSTNLSSSLIFTLFFFVSFLLSPPPPFCESPSSSHLTERYQNLYPTTDQQSITYKGFCQNPRIRCDTAQALFPWGKGLRDWSPSLTSMYSYSIKSVKDYLQFGYKSSYSVVLKQR